MLPAGVAERVADQVDDALLHHGLFPGGVDRLRQPLEAVADCDEHILDAAVLQLAEHLQPEPRPFRAVACPDTEDVAFPGRRDAHHDIERRVADLPVTDFHDDRVDEDHRVDRIQRPARPFGELPGDLLGDPADRVLGDLRPIDLVEVRGDLPGRQTPGGQRQHDLIDPVQAALALGHDHRLERPVTVPGDLDLDRADLGQHRLRPGPVAHVHLERGLAVLVTEILGQLRVQRRFEDVLRELTQQASRPGQAHALFFRLRKQPLGEV